VKAYKSIHASASNDPSVGLSIENHFHAEFDLDHCLIPTISSPTLENFFLVRQIDSYTRMHTHRFFYLESSPLIHIFARAAYAFRRVTDFQMMLIFLCCVILLFFADRFGFESMPFQGRP